MTESNIIKFCDLHVEGVSVRKLARQFNIPRSTIHYYLVKRLGKLGRRKQFGLFPIIREHIQQLSTKHKAEVQWWLIKNRQAILAADQASNVRLLTSHQEHSQSTEECWKGRDFRSVADSLYWGGSDAS